MCFKESKPGAPTRFGVGRFAGGREVGKVEAEGGRDWVMSATQTHVSWRPHTNKMIDHACGTLPTQIGESLTENFKTVERESRGWKNAGFWGCE